MQRVQFQAAYILHHRVFRESSLIIDALTPDYGVVRMVARGARSPKSRSRPLIQVFRPLLLSWTGRGEMKTLTGIEEQGMPFALQGLPLACGYYLNEVLLRLMSHNDRNITLFAHYSKALAQLAGPLDKIQTESCLRSFEIELLDSLGLVPDFADCVVEELAGEIAAETTAETTETEDSAVQEAGAGTTEPVVGERYQYFVQIGQAMKMPHKWQDDELLTGRLASSGIDWRASVDVSGEALLSLAERDFSEPECRVDMKRLMRLQLAMHLGAEPLKSREMIQFYSHARSH